MSLIQEHVYYASLGVVVLVVASAAGLASWFLPEVWHDPLQIVWGAGAIGALLLFVAASVTGNQPQRCCRYCRQWRPLHRCEPIAPWGRQHYACDVCLTTRAPWAPVLPEWRFFVSPDGALYRYDGDRDLAVYSAWGRQWLPSSQPLTVLGRFRVIGPTRARLLMLRYRLNEWRTQRALRA